MDWCCRPLCRCLRFGWSAGYEAIARTVSGLPSGALTLGSALVVAGRCLDPILSQQVTLGFWNPNTAVWIE